RDRPQTLKAARTAAEGKTAARGLPAAPGACSGDHCAVVPSRLPHIAELAFEFQAGDVVAGHLHLRKPGRQGGPVRGVEDAKDLALRQIQETPVGANDRVVRGGLGHLIHPLARQTACRHTVAAHELWHGVFLTTWTVLTSPRACPPGYRPCSRSQAKSSSPA